MDSRLDSGVIALCGMFAVYAQRQDKADLRDCRYIASVLCSRMNRREISNTSNTSNTGLLARREHVPDHAYQSPVFHGSGNTLLVGQLLVDCVRCGMCALFQTHINAEAWR